MTAQKRFADSGSTVSVVSFDPETLTETLPAHIYSVGFNPMMGFYLNKFGEQFEMPEQLFGDLEAKVDHLLDRYQRTGDMSAMLTGAKGSGKTLLAHRFSNRAVKELDRAVVIVDNHFDNPHGLVKFLHSLENCVFIFDEFAKKMGEHQDSFLDFFSGTYNTDRAVFVIENSMHHINEFMRERPGRVRWSFAYGKLPLAVVKEVCESRGLSEQATRNIGEYAARAFTIGMDNLNTIIDEVKLSGESAETREGFKVLLGMLNVPSNSTATQVLVKMHYKGKEYTAEGVGVFHCSPREAYLNLVTMENHPLIKAMIADENQWLLDAIERETWDDEDTNQKRIDWDDINITTSRPTFSNEGTRVFVHKESGVGLEVGYREDDDGLDFNQFL